MIQKQFKMQYGVINMKLFNLKKNIILISKTKLDLSNSWKTQIYEIFNVILIFSRNFIKSY